jgi:hypothetical protein
MTMRLRRHFPVLLLSITLAVVAGCGDDAIDQSTTSPATSDPSGSVSSPPLPDTGGTAPEPGTGQAASIRSRTDLIDPRPFEPTSVAADPSNNQRLLIRFWGGVEPCFGAEFRVVETATDVKVTVLGGAPPDAINRSCIALAKLYEGSVDLKAPLAARAIVVVK